MDGYCIYQGYTLMEAIECIDKNHDRAVIVINEEEKVLGIVSQGDIIRALCKGKNIYSRVDGIIRPDFYCLNEMNMEKAYEVFKKRKITLLPIIDGDYKLINVITLDLIYKYLEGKCKN